MSTATTSFGFESSGEEVAQGFADEIRGKNVLITGTSLGGMGVEVARTLAKYANLVIVAGSNDQRQQASVDSIKADVPGANVRKLILDLSSLEAVRKSAAEVNEYTEPIHILINNAAANASAYVVTKDGFEAQFAVDHLGHLLFTSLIIPRIRAARTASFSPRIIFVSSGGHHFGVVQFDNLNFDDGKTYAPWPAYAQAKSANILTVLELSKRLKSEGILSYSFHPGSIWTNLSKGLDKQEMINIGALDENGQEWDKFKWKTMDQGIATYIVAAFDPSIKDESGSYMVDCQVRNDMRAPHASDPALAARLWSLSEKLIGESLVV